MDWRGINKIANNFRCLPRASERTDVQGNVVASRQELRKVTSSVPCLLPATMGETGIQLSLISSLCIPLRLAMAHKINLRSHSPLPHHQKGLIANYCSARAAARSFQAVSRCLSAWAMTLRVPVNLRSVTEIQSNF